MPFEAQKITINGSPVRYYEAGEPFRDTILMLHGGYGDALTNWHDLMDLLRIDHHLIAPDLPGFGESAAIPNMTLEDLLDWCKQLIEQLGLDRAACIGHSFGALVGRLLAAHDPNLVPYAVLLSGGVIPNVSLAGKFIAGLPLVGKLLFNQMNSRSRADIVNAAHNKDAIKEPLIQATLKNTPALNNLMYMLMMGRQPANRRPKVPVLIIWGENDAIAPVSVAQSIQKNIPSSQLQLIAECGNLPHIEAADVLQWQFQGFVDTL